MPVAKNKLPVFSAYKNTNGSDLSFFCDTAVGNDLPGRRGDLGRDGGCHILGQTDLAQAVGGDAEHDIPGGAVLADGQQLVALGRRGAGAGQLDPIQRFLKLTHAQAAAVYFRRAQQCKEIVGNIDRPGVEPQLAAAQLHAGHVHDAQKLGGVVQQLGVQAGKGFGKAVQLPDAGAGQLRHFFGFLRRNNFAVKDLDRE